MPQSALYRGPVFETARRRFDGIADHFDITEDEPDRLLLPKRAIAVAFSVVSYAGETVTDSAVSY
jgi:glutamate dehydrogenase (NAD(P)+)